MGERNETGTRLAWGTAAGLGAAILFGVSAPVAKLMLRQCDPLMLAALLYLGGGTGLWLFEIFADAAGSDVIEREARVRSDDIPTLAAMIFLGGVLGPVLMLWGLVRLSAVVGSLLLNLEAPLTVVVALLAFHEHAGPRALLGVAAIVAGASVLGIEEGGFRTSFIGIAAIAGACLCWAVDTNLTQRLSVRDPAAIARIKAFGAGAVSLFLALVLRLPLPGTSFTVAALVVGAFSYGLSLMLHIHAMRTLGAARQAGFFAAAPFAGAVAALPILSERIHFTDAVAAVLMIAGISALITDHHEHPHRHDALEHDHLHTHDSHHQHDHDPGIPVTEPHSHWHRHEPILHSHRHVSDLHHRHSH